MIHPLNIFCPSTGEKISEAQIRKTQRERLAEAKKKYQPFGFWTPILENLPGLSLFALMLSGCTLFIWSISFWQKQIPLGAIIGLFLLLSSTVISTILHAWVGFYWRKRFIEQYPEEAKLAGLISDEEEKRENKI